MSLTHLILSIVNTNNRMQVLPPANGKKLWRVKRDSTGNPASLDAKLSLECLNNSLKISAAGKQFMSKRPPLKRPKSKPGMPKDFVFVDLSPVKTSEDEECGSVSSASSSPSYGEKLLPLSMTNDSFSSYEDDSYNNFNLNNSCNYQTQQPIYDNQLLGLGLMNMPTEYPQPSMAEMAMQMQQEQLAFQRFLQFQSQFIQTPQITQTPVMPPSQTPMEHRRSKSTSVPRRKSAGGFQFKTYKGPNTVKKPQMRKHRRCILEPSQKLAAAAAQMAGGVSTDGFNSDINSELEEFLQAPKNEISMDSLEQFDLAYTPLTDLSDFENVDTLHKPIDLDMMHGCDSHLFKEDFDMSSFVSI
ncbi:CIC11C00000001848 [Sungouiella intermedia]|uniref:CIC11C00000001848 n=1 Tax=Sungouiella intermedia TaxID=45354 RepID=A0A1L0BJI1_9ASCO|nr:CIC11C00000001848 [[Candida] intermedia]